MNRSLIYATLGLGIMAVGCLHVGYMPSRTIATIPNGVYERLSFKIDLPKKATSWEVGLWPAEESTNIVEFAGKHLVVTLTNVSTKDITLSPGVKSPFVRVLTLKPGQSAVLHDASIASAPQIMRLFGCDTHEHPVSFVLTLEFLPSVRLERQVTLLARGRDAL